MKKHNSVGALGRRHGPFESSPDDSWARDYAEYQQELRPIEVVIARDEWPESSRPHRTTGFVTVTTPDGTLQSNLVFRVTK